MVWVMGYLWNKLRSLTRGHYVGCDRYGNRYYRGAPSSGIYPHKNGRERRWVVYAGGERDATHVPPVWHGWLHHMQDDVPTDSAEPFFIKAHRPNRTGKSDAWVPAGSVLQSHLRPTATGDYQVWTPKVSTPKAFQDKEVQDE